MALEFRALEVPVFTLRLLCQLLEGRFPRFLNVIAPAKMCKYCARVLLLIASRQAFVHRNSLFRFFYQAFTYPDRELKRTKDSCAEATLRLVELTTAQGALILK